MRSNSVEESSQIATAERPVLQPWVPSVTIPDRRSRPTIRCLVNDLGIGLPPLDVDIGSLDHPFLDELRRVTPDSPRGQKRVLSIDYPLVYRIRGIYSGRRW